VEPEPEDKVAEAEAKFAKEQEERAIRLAVLQAKTPSQVGHVECQYGGKKKFQAVWLELGTDGILTMKAAKKGRDGNVLRTGSVVGCSVGELKNPRKGHSFAFRLDIAEKDSQGDEKYVLSVDTDEEKEFWMAKLGKWSEMSADGMVELAKDVEEVEAEAAAAVAAMPAPEAEDAAEESTSVIIT